MITEDEKNLRKDGKSRVDVGANAGRNTGARASAKSLALGEGAPKREGVGFSTAYRVSESGGKTAGDERRSSLQRGSLVILFSWSYGFLMGASSKAAM